MQFSLEFATNYKEINRIIYIGGIMKIVTFNTRYDNEEDGNKRFEFRKASMVNKIRQELPDIIGFQEVLPHMAEYLRNALPEYYILGHGRNEDYSGEQTAVAYLKNSYHLHHMKTFWLSETPLVPGSRHKGQSDCPRNCTCLVLYSIEHQKLIRVYNTHLDHYGSEARRLGLTQILRQISEDNKMEQLATFFMGDFNTTPDQPEMEELRAYGQLKELTDEIQVSFHDFGCLEQPEKIDYIYASPNVTKINTSQWWKDENGEYLSDHTPLCVEVNIL